MHDFDIICLSEIYLTSTTDINDENLKIPGYIMYRVDDQYLMLKEAEFVSITKLCCF